MVVFTAETSLLRIMAHETPSFKLVLDDVGWETCSAISSVNPRPFHDRSMERGTDDEPIEDGDGSVFAIAGVCDGSEEGR